MSDNSGCLTESVMTIVPISLLVEEHGHSAVVQCSGREDLASLIKELRLRYTQCIGIHWILYYVGNQILLILTPQTDETLSSFPIIKYFSSDIFFD